ncbi:unnamed protein product [Caenorhabditis brenneri]
MPLRNACATSRIHAIQCSKLTIDFWGLCSPQTPHLPFPTACALLVCRALYLIIGRHTTTRTGQNHRLRQDGWKYGCNFLLTGVNESYMKKVE